MCSTLEWDDQREGLQSTGLASFDRHHDVHKRRLVHPTPLSPLIPHATGLALATGTALSFEPTEGAERKGALPYWLPDAISVSRCYAPIYSTSPATVSSFVNSFAILPPTCTPPVSQPERNRPIMNLMTFPTAEAEHDLGQQIEVDEAVISRTFGRHDRWRKGAG